MPRKEKNAPNNQEPYVKQDFHSQDSIKTSTTSTIIKKKVKLRTSLDVYHRLMHDFTLGIDLHQVFIGYLDKYLFKIGKSETEIVEVCVLEWRLIDKGGDIPMHHISYFVYKYKSLQEQPQQQCCSLLLWDRNTRMDRLFGSGETKEHERLCHMIDNIKNSSNINNNNNNDVVEQQRVEVIGKDINNNNKNNKNNTSSATAVYSTVAEIVVIGGAICVSFGDISAELPGNTEHKHMTLLWRKSPLFTNDDIQAFEKYKHTWILANNERNNNNNNNTDENGPQSHTISFTLCKWYSGSMKIFGELHDFCLDIRRHFNCRNEIAINNEQRIPHVSLFMKENRWKKTKRKKNI